MITRREGLLATAAGVLAALVVGLGLWGAQRSRPEGWIRALLNDPEIRRKAVERLVQETAGIHDSHVDAEVGRVLLPGLRGRDLAGVACDTNELGLREGELSWEKPAGALRIVFLGDSYVFGWGVAPEERLGAVLERLLAEDGIQAECLHVGVVSWNVVAECAFLRRQLTTLRPDLVVQVLVTNDLEDCTGVRGIGVPAFYSPHVRERANGLVTHRVRMGDWPISSPRPTPLLHGLDHESRARYDDAAARIDELAGLVERSGGRYLLLALWDETLDVLRERVFDPVGLERCAFLPPRLAEDRTLWVTPADPHWNARGHELAGRIVRALVRARELLPGHVLPERPGEDALLASVEEVLRRSAEREPGERRRASCAPRSVLSFVEPEPEDAAQVYAGLAEGGEAAPYASLVVRNAGGELLLEGSPLQREELRGKQARVFVEEHELARIDLSPGPPFALRIALPHELAERSHVAVRFLAEDYVYRDLPTTRCVAFRLERVASLQAE